MEPEAIATLVLDPVGQRTEWKNLVKEIRYALSVERERCAKVAEGYKHSDDPGDLGPVRSQEMLRVCANIAAKIRELNT